MERTLSKSGFAPKLPESWNSLFAKLLARFRNNPDTEPEQAMLRLALVGVGLFYTWLATHYDLGGTEQERADIARLWAEWWWPSMYFMLALIHIAGLIAFPGRFFPRRVFMVLADNAAITVLVWHGGLFNPFLAYYFWIGIGYGFRFGPNWLAYSTIVSIIGIAAALNFNPLWDAGSAIGPTLILSLCIVSGYAFHLLFRLKQVQHNLALKAAELEKLATYDYLTGLPNRALLMDRLTHAITLSTRTGGDVALLFIDLDGLKTVNDKIGHAAGDALLIEVSKKLLARLRATDTCARIAGDEFVIVLEGAADRDSILRLADTLLKEVRSFTSIAGQPIAVSASIGLAWLSDIGKPAPNPDTFLAAADSAMYEAKHSGKNRYCIAKARSTQAP